MRQHDYQTTQGILDAIEFSANEFESTRNLADASSRMKACDVAIKIHALEHMKDRFDTMKMEKAKLNSERRELLEETKF